MSAKTLVWPAVFPLTTVALWSLAFIIPFLFNGSQIITGSLINALLFISAHRIQSNHWPPLVILPSLGALGHGLLFGPFTPFLFYFLPSIWLGNYLLLRLSQPLMAISAKTATLYLTARLLITFSIVPSSFLIPMGAFQLLTAIVGLLIATIYDRSRPT